MTKIPTRNGSEQLEGTLPLRSLSNYVNSAQYSALTHIYGTIDAGMGTIDFLLDLIYTSHACLLVVVSFTAGRLAHITDHQFLFFSFMKL